MSPTRRHQKCESPSLHSDVVRMSVYLALGESPWIWMHVTELCECLGLPHVEIQTALQKLAADRMVVGFSQSYLRTTMMSWRLPVRTGSRRRDLFNVALALGVVNGTEDQDWIPLCVFVAVTKRHLQYPEVELEWAFNTLCSIEFLEVRGSFVRARCTENDRIFAESLVRAYLNTGVGIGL